MNNAIAEIDATIDLIKNHCTRRGIKVVAHECSLCGYPCGFFWDESDDLYYDSGCDCTKKQFIEKREKSDFIDFMVENSDLVTQFLLHFKNELT